MLFDNDTAYVAVFRRFQTDIREWEALLLQDTSNIYILKKQK